MDSTMQVNPEARRGKEALIKQEALISLSYGFHNKHPFLSVLLVFIFFTINFALHSNFHSIAIK